MRDSGPILQYKPLLGQLATCIPLEVCVLQLSTHAKILGLPDMAQKDSSKSRTIQQLICLWPSLERVEAWQILRQDSSASCCCASDCVSIGTRRGVHHV